MKLSDRYDAKIEQSYRKFCGESEVKVDHSDELLNDAIRFGDEISKAEYDSK